jgi:hypothetical protein
MTAQRKEVPCRTQDPLARTFSDDAFPQQNPCSGRSGQRCYCRRLQHPATHWWQRSMVPWCVLPTCDIYLWCTDDFQGPESTGISSDIPDGCKIDLVASFSRHGSRYPDTGAYNQWVDLYKRVQAAGPALKVTDSKLKFLPTWKPVLSNPERQIAQISTTGYKELASMGADWRLRYADLYEYNSPFDMWSNYYTGSPRVRDSARMFAQYVLPTYTMLVGWVLTPSFKGLRGTKCHGSHQHLRT